MAKQRQNITAVIYDKRGRVLSIGQNTYTKTHPLQAKHASLVGLPLSVFLHAEIHAIVRCKDLSRAHKISVFRFSRNGTPVNSKPCKICMSAIRAAGIRHIEHT